MEAVIDQTFCNMHGLHAFFCLQFVAEDHLVHGGRGIRQIVNSFQAFADVVGVENRIFRGLTQTIGAVGKSVGESADEHSEVAVEGAHPSH